MKQAVTIVLSMIIILSAVAQEADTYRQYMSVYIKPNLKSVATLQANMQAHNKTYHTDGPFAARVFAIQTGPYAGWWLWQMGPCTFAEMDERKEDKAHDDRWTNEILPYCDEVKNFEFWRRDDGLSNLDNFEPPYATVRLRFVNVTKGQDHRVKPILEKIKSTLATMPGENYWGVYDNMFLQGYELGRHMALITPFKTMADIDKGDEFVKYFEELYGPNSFQSLIKDWGDTFSDTYDEYLRYIPDLDGAAE